MPMMKLLSVNDLSPQWGFPGTNITEKCLEDMHETKVKSSLHEEEYNPTLKTENNVKSRPGLIISPSGFCLY